MVWFAEDTAQLTQVEPFGNQANDINMSTVATSRLSDATLTRSSGYDPTTMSVASSGGIMATQSSMGQAKKVPRVQLDSPSMTLKTPDVSRYVPTLAIGHGSQQIIGPEHNMLSGIQNRQIDLQQVQLPPLGKGTTSLLELMVKVLREQHKARAP